MGLLGKAAAKQNAPAEGAAASGAAAGGVLQFLTNFHRKHPQFHVVILQGRGNLHGMIACHGAAIAGLPGGNTLILLPGALDRELFAHRISQSTGLTALSQLSTDSPARALETLSPYLP